MEEEPHQTYLLNQEERATGKYSVKSLSRSFSQACQTLHYFQTMETGRTILPRPLVLGQLFHFPGQMAVDAIFRTHLRWSIQGFFNHLFLWVQSPALSGNGSLSASQVPLGTGPTREPVTEEEPGTLLSTEAWKRSKQEDDVCPSLGEKKDTVLLREPESWGQGTASSSKDPHLRRATSVGTPSLKRPENRYREASQCSGWRGDNRSTRILVLYGKPKAMG